MRRARKMTYLLLAFFSLISLSATNHLSEVDLLQYPVKVKGELSGKSMTMYLKQDKLLLEGLTIYGADSSYWSVKGEVKNDTVYLKEFDSYGSNTCDFTGTISGFRFKGKAFQYNGNQASEFKFLITKGKINTSQDVLIGDQFSKDDQEEDNRKSKRQLFKLLFFLILLISVLVWLYLRFGDKWSKMLKHQDKVNDNSSRETIDLYSNQKNQNKKSNEEKGLNFEKYVAELIYKDKHHFTIEEWRGDKFHQGIYALSNTYPDFKIKYSIGKESFNFSIECKFRQNIKKDDWFEICTTNQFERYITYSKEHNIEVFIIIGSEGEGSRPETLYLIPLKDLHSNRLSYLKLQKYRVMKSYERFHFDPVNRDLRLV